MNEQGNEEVRRVLEETMKEGGGFEADGILGNKGNIEDVRYESDIVLGMYNELHPIVYGFVPEMSGATSADELFREHLEGYVNTYAQNPFPVVETFAILLNELNSFRPEEVASDEERKKSLIQHVVHARTVLEEVFHARYPREYEARFVEST